MVISRKALLSVSVSLVSAMAPTLVRAQTTELTLPASVTASSSAGTGAASGTGLQEIVVTAQQRGENQQKAAIAIDVVKGSSLVSSGVTTVESLGKLVPALTIEGTANGSLVFIRGVGNFSFQPSSDPASAFNIDGVYVGRTSANEGSFFDLQRIEVLKGPQGTLYGRNATAGAINLIPVQPTLGQWSGYGIASYGNYNSVTAEGGVNAPIGASAALRVSGTYVRHDAYLADGTGTDNSGGVRAQLKVRLSPDLTVRLDTDYAHQGGTGDGVNYVGTYALNAATQQYVITPAGISPSQGIFTPASQAFRETVLAGAAGRDLGALTNKPFEKNDFYGASLHIDWETPLGTVSVIPAWRHSRRDNLAVSGFNNADDQPVTQYSAEARIVSNPGKTIDYNLGAYYFNETINDFQAANSQNVSAFTGSHYKTSSPAVYGRLTWHVSDRLRLTGGVRYTDDRKSFYSASQTLALVCRVATGCPTAPLLPFTTSLGEQPYVPAASGGIIPVSPGALVARSDSSASGKSRNNKVTYRGAIEYDVAPRSMAYASIETGYRSGGFNSAIGFTTFNPETITAYTVGLKNRFFDNRVQLNIEAFDWEYHNQQLSNLGVDATGRPTLITANSGRSTIRGAEVEGQFQIDPKTTLSADVQYLRTKYTSYKFQSPVAGGVPFTGCAVSKDTTNAAFYDVNCGGLPLANSPRWTVNAGLEHTIPIGDYKIVLDVNTQYRSGRFDNIDYISAEHVSATTQTDAEVSFSPSNARWSLTAFAHNLESNRFAIFSFPVPQSKLIAATYAPPRTYGVRVGVKF